MRDENAQRGLGFGVVDGAVTAVTALRKDPSRVSIKVDRRNVAVMGRDTAERLGIAVGVAWTAEMAAEAAEAVSFDKAKRFAVRSLGMRPLSKAGVVERVVAKGYPKETAARVAEHLERLGLIGDKELARSLAEAELRRKPAGRRFVEAKLRRKKIDAATTKEVVGEVFKGRDAVADAIALAKKRLRGRVASGSEAATDPRIVKRRLFGWLARRGFDPDTCRKAVEKVVGRVGEDEDEASA